MAKVIETRNPNFYLREELSPEAREGLAGYLIRHEFGERAIALTQTHQHALSLLWARLVMHPMHLAAYNPPIYLKQKCITGAHDRGECKCPELHYSNPHFSNFGAERLTVPYFWTIEKASLESALPSITKLVEADEIEKQARTAIREPNKGRQPFLKPTQLAILTAVVEDEKRRRNS